MTCAGATRHTFQVMNQEMTRFWPYTEVRSLPDFDKHDLLFSCFDLPRKVLKWILPRSFMDGPIDKAVLVTSLEGSASICEEEVCAHLENGDVGQALEAWSQAQEQAFVEAACHCDGEPRALSSKYLGRCARTEPKFVHLSQPRLKSGRPGDYRPPHVVATLHVRQLVRQTRRLQRRVGPPRVDALQLWDAVISGAGFGTSFPKWFVRHHGWFPTEL